MFRQQQGGTFPTVNQPYPNARIQPPNVSQPTYSSPLDQIKQYTGKFEDILASLMDPIKPYCPPIPQAFSFANATWQIFACYRTVFDCCDIPWRCFEDRNSIWRSDLLPYYLSCIFALGCCTYFPYCQCLCMLLFSFEVDQRQCWLGVIWSYRASTLRLVLRRYWEW